MNTNSQSEHKNHSLSLNKRAKLDIDGVIDILEFDNNSVNVKTTMGVLSIEGDGLKIISMSKDNAQIYIEGSIDSLYYYDDSPEKKNGIFKRRGR